MSPAAFGQPLSDASAKPLANKAKSGLRQLIENQLTEPRATTPPTPPFLSADHPAAPHPRGGIRAKVLYGGLCDPMQRNQTHRIGGAGE